MKRELTIKINNSDNCFVKLIDLVFVRNADRLDCLVKFNKMFFYWNGIGNTETISIVIYQKLLRDNN